MAHHCYYQVIYVIEWISEQNNPYIRTEKNHWDRELNFPEDDTIFLNDEPKDKLFEKDKNQH